jgi:hypothetical protein
MTIYLGFITSLAATFTPTIDDGARIFAGLLSFVLAVVIGFHAWEEVKAVHPDAGKEDKGQGAGTS